MNELDQVEEIWRRTDPPIWIVTAASEARRAGLVATFVSKASIVASLPRVVVGLAKPHATWELVRSSRALNLHLVTPAQVDWIPRFALASSRDVDKFEGLAVAPGRFGSPVLSDAPAVFECRVEEEWDTGDRSVFLVAVEHACIAPIMDFTPLGMGRAAQLLSPEVMARLSRAREEDSLRDAAAILARRRETGFSSRTEDRP